MSAFSENYSSFFRKLDFGIFTLLFVNILAIYLAITQKWDVATVFWSYWLQSIIIGIFNFIRIFFASNVSSKSLSPSGFKLPESPVIQIFVALFFAVHYGLFHLVYFFFLSFYSIGISVPVNEILLIGAIFFLNHLISFGINYPREKNSLANIGCLFFLPYARVVPFHLVMLIGGLLLGNAGVVLLMFLKTLADLITHYIEHNINYIKLAKN